MICVKHLGRAPYRPVWDLQHRLHSDMVERKRSGEEPGEEWILTVEHDPVITLGKHAKTSNLLFSEEVLQARGIESIRIERGGDVTFHGPGQLVVYPIIDLERHRLGVKDYVHLLEEAVIRTVAEYGITGQRVDGASGVWIGVGTSRERKICALGVKCTRFVTMHGLALNVTTDLSYFGLINPCGFVDKGVTSIELETGKRVPLSDVADKVTSHLLRLLK